MARTVLLRERKYLWAPFWGALFFVMMILGTIFWFLHYNLTVAYNNDFNGDLLAQFAEHKKETDLSVVMLGNSRLRNATRAGYSVAEIFTLPDGRTVTFLQLAKNAATLQAYEGLLPQRLNARPDVLVIQDSLVSNFKTARFVPIDLFRAALDFYIDRIKAVRPYDKWYEMRSTPIECKPRKYDRQEMENYLNYKSNVRHTLGDENPNFVLSQGLVRNALALGTAVVMLRIDPYVDYFNRMEVPLHRSTFHGFGREPTHEELLPDDYGHVLWWRYTETKDENYCDMIHVNDKGAEAFTNWLFKGIQKADPQ